MDLLTKIEHNFQEMIKTEKVDLSVVTPLKEFNENLINLKESLLKEKLLSQYFHVFHAIETQIRIINHMTHRVSIAPKIHDNPKVAEDALVVIPQLKLIQETLKSKSRDDPHYIMDLSSNLQILAMKLDMYPKPQQIAQSANKKIIDENFNYFVGAINEEIERI